MPRFFVVDKKIGDGSLDPLFLKFALQRHTLKERSSYWCKMGRCKN